MKHLILTWLIVFTGFVAVLSACTAVKLAIPSQEDANRGSQLFAGFGLTELNQGKALFETKCTVCHGLKDPTSKTPEKWKNLVDEMTKKANKKAGKVVITAQEQDLIGKYVLTMHTAVAPKK